MKSTVEASIYRECQIHEENVWGVADTAQY
jgi:hypothetical protein